MGAPSAPHFQPYKSAHQEPKGAGDTRPTALQVVKDSNVLSPALKDRTILITGCSSGLGVETARALYETSAKLYLTARDVPKLEKVIDDIVSKSALKDVPKPVALKLDLTSLASVKEAASTFLDQQSRLNILINNAGVMAAPYGQTQDGFEMQIGVNHMAHFLLFQLLKPALLEAAKTSGTTSRVVNVSSAGHRSSGIKFDNINFEQPGSYDKWDSYGQSKTATIYMANSISRHYGQQGLVGLSVHPGGIMTELGRHLSPEDLKRFGEDFTWDKIAHIFKSPEQGAATQVWAAVDKYFDDPAHCGVYLADVGVAAPSAADEDVAGPGYREHAYDEPAEEKLWKLSCKAVGVDED